MNVVDGLKVKSYGEFPCLQGGVYHFKDKKSKGGVGSHNSPFWAGTPFASLVGAHIR